MPLNPVLYRLLQERFGEVRVYNEGVAQVSNYCYNALEKRDYLSLIEPGEYYAVNCPFCNDTRHRLYFNHMWGHRDSLDRRNLWLVICYNENCCEDSERRLELWSLLLDPTIGSLDRAPIRKGKEVDPTMMAADWPGPVERVDKLSPNHKAVQYLSQDRGFDVKMLGKFYNVHYCRDSFRMLARDRIIIPIYEEKKLVGWQARFVGEMDWHRRDAPPKYFTCPGTPRRLVLYNFANAIQYRFGVIMEGPTDVWALGPMGLCTLGASMTTAQRAKFIAAFRNYGAILLYDPDTAGKESVLKLRAALESVQFRLGFANIALPKDHDPGSFNRDVLRGHIVYQAKQQGVAVNWQKR